MPFTYEADKLTNKPTKTTLIHQRVIHHLSGITIHQNHILHLRQIVIRQGVTTLQETVLRRDQHRHQIDQVEIILVKEGGK